MARRGFLSLLCVARLQHGLWRGLRVLRGWCGASTLLCIERLAVMARAAGRGGARQRPHHHTPAPSTTYVRRAGWRCRACGRQARPPPPGGAALPGADCTAREQEMAVLWPGTHPCVACGWGPPGGQITFARLLSASTRDSHPDHVGGGIQLVGWASLGGVAGACGGAGWRRLPAVQQRTDLLRADGPHRA